MRIQHNIAALSAYRNLTNNNSAVSKNLEKLSSGYRINRAGDDAAGLAISEKMRAQITGLETAQKNANDGISLVQTAEGALTEVHSMLNRMVELANQSANGTYADKVDRENLQAEVNSLLDEIDRISKSTNFNGLNLLDGSMDSGAVAASTTWSDPVGLTTIKAAGNTHGTDSVLHKDGVTRQEPEFVVDLTDVKVDVTDTGGGYKVAIGGTTLTITTKDGKGGTTALAKGDELTGSALATAIANAVNDNDSGVKGKKAADGTDTTANLKGIKIGDLVFKADVDGNNVKLSLQTKDTTNADIKAQTLPTDGTVTITQNPVKIEANDIAKANVTGVDAAGHANTQIKWGVGETPSEMACAYIELTADQINDGTKITVGDKTFVFAIGADSKVEAGKEETLINMKNIKTDDSQKLDKAIALMTQNSGEWFRLESPASGKMIAVEKKTYAGEGDLKTFDGLKSNFKISQMKVTEADEGDKTKSLTLQIGDTADDFNQMSVNIKSMSTESLGLKDLSIATQADAQGAVDKIKEAINMVSSTRGDLGAIQNRLEHTINNLSVTTENITAAESRIRDVDMASEMMAYTKNNILVQASQAMLAQANQIPQGVLQLLQ